MSDKIEIDEQHLKQVIQLLDQYYDFSGYKESTLKRRISKRMQALKLSSTKAYIAYIQTNLVERQQLAYDIFINVTHFFRDIQVFHFIHKTLLPTLIQRKNPHQTLRIWTAGCASGEEAYSIAILLNEYERQHNCNLNVKIIATDVKASSIEKAKRGIYSTRNVHHIPPKYLSRYFILKDGAYHVNKILKKRILFSIHDITQDPPYGKIDLILCRNLLIYFNKDLQRKIFTNIAFSLNLNAYLVLGKSETLVEHSPIFKPLRSTLKIYEKVSNKRQEHFFHLNIDYKNIITGIPLSAMQAKDMQHQSVNEAFQQLLYRSYSPAVVVIDQAFRVQHINRKARQYVEVPEDFTYSHELFAIAAPEISAVVRTAMAAIKQHEARYTYPNVQVQRNDQDFILDISVEVLLIDQTKSFYAIILIPSSSTSLSPDQEQEQDQPHHPLVQDINLSLQSQLLQTEKNLQKTIQELEASNQNLLASNEELQSTNEEYISVNEELQNINAEYQHSIDELSQVNQDIDHLLQSTDIGTIFLDHELKIRKFTSAIQSIINVTAVDINRPFEHITNNLVAVDLIQEITSAKQHGQPTEKEVQLKNEHWLLMKLVPYENQSTKQIGIVISFINIQPLKTTEAQLRKQQIRFKGIFNNTYQFIGLLSTEGIVLEANEPALAFGALQLNDVVGKPLWETYWWQISEDIQKNLKKALVKAASGEFVRYNVDVWGANQTTETIDFTLKPVFNDHQQVVYIVAEGRIISEEIRTQNALQRSELQYKNLIEGSQELIHNMDLEGNLLFVNRTWQQKLEYTDEDLKTLKIFDLIPKNMHAHCQKILEQVITGRSTDKINVVFKSKTGKQLNLFGDLIPYYEKEQVVSILVFLKDVTEQRKAKIALKDSEELYRSLFNTSYLGLMLYDLELQKVITTNTKILEILGYTEAEIKEKKAYDFVPSHLPDGTPSKTMIDNLTQQALTGEFIHITIPSLHKDGTIFMTDVTLSPVRVKNKTHVLVSIRDISEEIKQQQIIEVSQQRFKAIFDYHPIGISLANAQNKIIQVNDALAKILGYSKEELAGMSFLEITHPNDQVSNKQELKKLIKGKINYIKFEKRYLRKDGSDFLASVSVSTFKNTKDELLYIASIQDISQQRQTELQLIEREQLYRNLYDNSYNAICILNLDNISLVDCNQRYLDIFQVSKKEMFSIDPMRMLAPIQHNNVSAKDFITTINQQSIEKGRYRYSFIGHRIKSNQPFYAKATSIFHQHEGKKQLIILVQDIDAEYRHKATIEQKVRELDEKNQELEKYINSNLELENFAYIASHDLREPLRTITSFSQLLEHRHDDSLPAEAKEYLQFIHKATRNLNMVVEDLLKFSRVNTQEFTRQKVDLNQLLGVILSDLQKKIDIEQVVFNIEVLPKQLSVNRSQIYQVFQNLINNAIKFRHADRQPVIKISAQQKQHVWQFTVTDNGIGIEEEYQEKIFLLFKRLHNKERYEGTGLGLAICKKVIEKHEGRIWMESVYGQGTSFHFTLPIVKA